jgi:hypothetical protein
LNHHFVPGIVFTVEEIELDMNHFETLLKEQVSCASSHLTFLSSRSKWGPRLVGKGENNENE